MTKTKKAKQSNTYSNRAKPPGQFGQKVKNKKMTKNDKKNDK